MIYYVAALLGPILLIVGSVTYLAAIVAGGRPSSRAGSSTVTAVLVLLVGAYLLSHLSAMLAVP